MDRMKTFLKYLLVLVICYFGSNTLIYAAINNTYDNIANYQYIDESSLSITINEAKSTSINGYVKGTIKNNSNYKIKEQYIKIDFYSSRNVNMGTKYIKVENLKSKDTIDFDMDFKFSNVSYCVITTVNKSYCLDYNIT